MSEPSDTENDAPLLPSKRLKNSKMLRQLFDKIYQTKKAKEGAILSDKSTPSETLPLSGNSSDDDDEDCSSFGAQSSVSTFCINDQAAASSHNFINLSELQSTPAYQVVNINDFENHATAGRPNIITITDAMLNSAAPTSTEADFCKTVLDYIQRQEERHEAAMVEKKAFRQRKKNPPRTLRN